MILEMLSKITRRDSHKFSVFILTFFSYALFHANRKAFSNVKSSTGEVWTPYPHNASVPALQPNKIWNSHDMFDNKEDAEKFQGVLDTSFMLAYAIGLFLNGYIGDRVNMRILLTVGMAGTSVLVFIFGFLCEMLTFYNKYFYCIIWIVNGLMQSTGWPVVVACMGNWFGKSSRGVLLGLWSACASVGNIIGALMVSFVLSYGYQFAFLLTSSTLLAVSLIIFFGLIPSPEDVGMAPVEEDSDDMPRTGSINAGDEEQRKTKNGDIYVIDCKLPAGDIELKPVPKKEPLLSDSTETGVQDKEATIDEDITYAIETTKPASLSFWKACLLPGVMPYSLAYAFLKLVNYSFFFWLPFYLSSAFHWEESEADRLSIAYDIAGIVGGTLVGLMSDYLGKRTILIVPMLIVSIPSLLWYSKSPDDQMINMALMALVGFFIGGAANLISAAVSADLGCQKQLQGNDKALATVTGIVDGTGSLGAALGQIAVPYLQVSLGWQAVFYLFMICMFLTAFCLFPLFIKEIQTVKWVSRCSRRRQLNVTSDTIN